MDGSQQGVVDFEIQMNEEGRFIDEHIAKAVTRRPRTNRVSEAPLVQSISLLGNDIA
jgi:hypothetical protein